MVKKLQLIIGIASMLAFLWITKYVHFPNDAVMHWLLFTCGVSSAFNTGIFGQIIRDSIEAKKG